MVGHRGTYRFYCFLRVQSLQTRFQSFFFTSLWNHHGTWTISVGKKASFDSNLVLSWKKAPKMHGFQKENIKANILCEFHLRCFRFNHLQEHTCWWDSTWDVPFPQLVTLPDFSHQQYQKTSNTKRSYQTEQGALKVRCGTLQSSIRKKALRPHGGMAGTRINLTFRVRLNSASF